jgi:hypothetical protein
MRELLRRGALIATDETGVAVVEQKHIDDAIRELVIAGGSLTRSLLGATQVAESG